MAKNLTMCLTETLSHATRENLKEYYRIAKKYGIRVGFGLVSGTGGYTLLK